MAGKPEVKYRKSRQATWWAALTGRPFLIGDHPVSRKRATQADSKGSVGTGAQIARLWLGGRIDSGLLASRVFSDIVYQATPRDPAVLAGVVLAMAMLGLVATWIPARRALSADPTILLREE